MKYRYSTKWVNLLFHILNGYLKDNSIRTILVYGSKSSAKTVSIAQLLSKELCVYGSSSIAFRKESTTINTTIKKSFDLARNTMFLFPVMEKFDKFYRSKDAEIQLRGIDDEEKAKGIESYKYVYLDELNHFEEAEWLMFQMSLRGIEGQKILGSWNPVDENCWIKQMIDSETWVDQSCILPDPHSWIKRSQDGKTILIKTVYQDNYWINGSQCGTYGYRDENLIAEYEKLKTRDYNRYKVNVLGEWGKLSYGGEAYKRFQPERNVKSFDYNPDFPLHISFDFNLRPGMHAVVFQVNSNDKIIYQLAEIVTRSPRNSTKYACDDFINLPFARGHRAGLFIYGDPSGRSGSTRQEEGKNDYTIILHELRNYRPTLRVAFQHPNPKQRIGFINSIFDFNEDWKLYIHPNCKYTIEDLLYVKEDENGAKVKEKFKDADSGLSYEKYCHLTDAWDYAICEVLREQYKKYQNPFNVISKDLFQQPTGIKSNQIYKNSRLG
jgi:PBSX family phage terminase large subunit